MNKICNILFSLVFIIALGIGGSPAYADTDPQEIANYLNSKIVPSQVNESDLFKQNLSDLSKFQEIIDPQTGTLQLKVTDITLPGKDGFDLSIARTYNSSQAEFQSKKAGVGQSSYYTTEYIDTWWYTQDVYDYWTDQVETTWYGPFATEAEASQDSSTCYVGPMPSYSPDWYYYAPSSPFNVPIAVQVENYYYYSFNASSPINYLESRYDLGHGWAFAFPSIEFAGGSMYFHDGTGSVYEVDTSFSSATNLKKYQGADVLFARDSGSYINGGTSAYKFVSADQLISYFDTGGKLLGIKDIFGNEIKFSYIQRQLHGNSYWFIDTIVDSIGRTVKFTYQNTIDSAAQNSDTAETITVTINDPDNTKSVQFIYTKKSQTLSYYSESEYWRTYNDKYLWSVEDPLQNRTYYRHVFQDSGWANSAQQWNFFSKSPSGMSHYMALISKVVSPRLGSIYSYEQVTRNLGTNGSYQGLRVKTRHNQERLPDLNGEFQFSSNILNNEVRDYQNDYTGYNQYYNEESLPASYTYGVTVTDGIGLKTQYVYNGIRQELKRHYTAANNEQKIVTNQTFDTTWNLKPTKVEVTEQSGAGQVNKYYLGYSYNNWGGLASETTPLTELQFNGTDKVKYTTTYEYEPTWKFLKTKTWYQNIEDAPISSTWVYYPIGTGTGIDGRIHTETKPNGDTVTYNYSTTAEGRVEEIINSEFISEGNYQQASKTVLTYGPLSKNAFPTTIKKYYTDSSDQVNPNKEDVETITYDLLWGSVKTETDSIGRLTQYEYDNLGRTKRIQLPDVSAEAGETFGVIQDYDYLDVTSEEPSNTSLPLRSKVGSGIIYSSNITGNKVYLMTVDYYNGFGYLTKREKWDHTNQTLLSTETYEYDNMMSLKKTTDASGNVYTYSYDKWGNLEGITDPFGNLFMREYKLLPKKIANYYVQASDVAAFTTNRLDTFKHNYSEYSLDNEGRVFERKSFPDGITATKVIKDSVQYDIVGNLKSYTDPKGQTTTYKYNKLDKLSQIIDPLSQVTSYEYSPLGKLSKIKQVEDIRELTTTHTYNELGYKTGTTDHGSITQTYVPDPYERLKQTIDPNGIQFDYSYDTHNRIKTEQANGFSKTYTYGANPFGVKTLAQQVGTTYSNSLEYSFYPDGRIKTEDLTNAGFTSNILYDYDSAGKLESVKDPFGRYVNYKYNKDRLDKIQTDGGSTYSPTEQNSIAYEYYPNGSIKTVTYPILSDGTNLKTEYQYDEMGRILFVTNLKGSQQLSRFGYTYDDNSNIETVNIETATNSPGTTTYHYDGLNRLTEVIQPNGQKVTYSYDARGNRKTTNENPSENIFDPVSFKYDSQNRMSEVTNYNGTATFEYGPNDYRTQKTSSQGTTRFHYNSSGKLIAESSGTNQATAQYTWGVDRILAKNDNTGQYYYLYNGHGDVVQVVDTSGNIKNTYQYDEWGKITDKAETVKNPIRYSGYYFDDESGLYYVLARYYDPAVGRFITKDTFEGQITNPLSLNLYTYCLNNPLLYTDPTGNIPLLAITAIGGAIIGGAYGAYKSYQETGSVKLSAVVKGALIGGVAGATLGAGASLLSSTAVGGASLTLTPQLTIAGFSALVQGGRAATLWGVSKDGVNQGIKHFYVYATNQPQRIASISERMGIGTFELTKAGFEKFTNAAMNVVSNYEKLGGLTRTVGEKTMYYYNEVVIIMYNGKIQSVMRATEKTFNKME